MSMTTKSLALTAVIASSIAVMAADSAPRSRADELRPAAPGAATQGSSAQSTSSQGSSAQGTWDAVTLGRVEPRLGEIKIAAPLPGGRIAEILVKPNEEVFAGELLARLDDEEATAFQARRSFGGPTRLGHRSDLLGCSRNGASP